MTFGCIRFTGWTRRSRQATPYPSGLPVARVVRVERRADSAFARVYCKPLAQVQGARHVVVLQPLPENASLPRPEPAHPVPVKRGGRKG